MKIELLKECHTDALFRFETENRSWFEKYVPPRPQTYNDIEQFSKVVKNLVYEQQSGECFLYLIVVNENIIGRVNISEVKGTNGEIGFRIAEDYIGKGITTAALKMLIEKAFSIHGLDKLIAKTTSKNYASQSVIKKCGFNFTHEIKEAGLLNNKSIDFYCYSLEKII